MPYPPYTPQDWQNDVTYADEAHFDHMEQGILDASQSINSLDGRVTYIEDTPAPPGPQGPEGPQGTPGEKWFTGSGAPAGATGIVGDWYLDSVSGNYYEKTATTTWTLRGNLLGPQGAQGEQGPQGAQGPQGTAGVGIPAGGGSGQVLTKASATNYDTVFADARPKVYAAEATAPLTLTTSAQPVVGTTLTLPAGLWLVIAVFDLDVTAVGPGVLIGGFGGTATVVGTPVNALMNEPALRMTVSQTCVVQSTGGQTVFLTASKLNAAGTAVCEPIHTTIRAISVI